MIQANKLSGKEAVTENSKCKDAEVENGLVYSRNWQKKCIIGTQ